MSSVGSVAIMYHKTHNIFSVYDFYKVSELQSPKDYYNIINQIKISTEVRGG